MFSGDGILKHFLEFFFIKSKVKRLAVIHFSFFMKIAITFYSFRGKKFVHVTEKMLNDRLGSSEEVHAFQL